MRRLSATEEVALMETSTHPQEWPFLSNRQISSFCKAPEKDKEKESAPQMRGSRFAASSRCTKMLSIRGIVVGSKLFCRRAVDKSTSVMRTYLGSLPRICLTGMTTRCRCFCCRLRIRIQPSLTSSKIKTAVTPTQIAVRMSLFSIGAAHSILTGLISTSKGTRSTQPSNQIRMAGLHTKMALPTPIARAWLRVTKPT